MANRHNMNRYLLLVHDLCFSNKYPDSGGKKFESMSGISQYPKGTLLEEVPISPPSTRLTCMVLDTEEMIECNEDDVDPLTVAIKDLLLAISSCKDRFEVFKNKERLGDGIDMQPGTDVIVRLPVMSGEVLGKLRYKGAMQGKEGIYFGIELINARGKGNSNGTVNNHRYFECPDDCAVFLALNRVTSCEYDQLQTHVPSHSKVTSKSSKPKHPSGASTSHHRSSSYTSNTMGGTASTSSSSSNLPSVLNVSEEELIQLNIFIGMEVFIFTEVNGAESQERGTVKFIGRIPGELPTNDIYAGIELVNPTGNGRGVFNRRQLFKTKLNHAALVPLSGILPANTFDYAPPPQTSGTHRTEPIEDAFTAGFGRHHNVPGSRRPFSSPAGFTRNGEFFERPTARMASEPFRNESRPLAKELVPHRRKPDNSGTIVESEDNLYPQNPDIFGSHRSSNSNRVRYPPNSREKPDYVEENLHHFEDYTLLEVGSMVEIADGIENQHDVIVGPVYGVIRWIGRISDLGEFAGIELEAERFGFDLTDGTFMGIRYFNCQDNRALFVPLHQCRKDRRFDSPADTSRVQVVPQATLKSTTKHFGDFEAPQISGCVTPPSKLSETMLGKGKGIQGHHNSCYLDSTLFSLFAYSYCLDSLILRDRTETDIPEYQQVQQVLKESIVNPLRAQNFVRADKIMELRKLLDRLSSVTGLTNEEKDPEEFLHTLLMHVFKADPLIELRVGDSEHIQECYFYQIFLDKDEKMVLPSTQLLLEQSFLGSDLKFRDVPVCLILQMPRFGKDYRMYNRVRPSLTLDVTDMVEKIPRSCTVCGGLAEYECKQCSIERSMQDHISSYCANCAQICHQHPLRRQHNYKKTEVYDEYRSFIAQEGERSVERQVLDLYAVVCIETSHYVSFAKCGNGPNAKWCFFDSMADRVGEQNGYNIPQVTYCEKFEEWLNMDQRVLLEMNQREMPEYLRRLLCDAYMCLYQSREMMCFT